LDLTFTCQAENPKYSASLKLSLPLNIILSLLHPACTLIQCISKTHLDIALSILCSFFHIAAFQNIFHNIFSSHLPSPLCSFARACVSLPEVIFLRALGDQCKSEIYLCNFEASFIHFSPNMFLVSGRCNLYPFPCERECLSIHKIFWSL
jgi:hypothetical protein